MHVAAKKTLPTLAGLVVVDVVEVRFLENNAASFSVYLLKRGLFKQW